MDRRKFLKTTAGGALVTIAIAPAASGCGNNVSAAPLTRAIVITDAGSQFPGAQATINDDIRSMGSGYGTITLVVDYYPDLAKPGGALTIELPIDASDQNRAYAVPTDNTVLVVHRPDGTFGAFQSSCPHAGCPLGYAGKDIECPCHSSRFAADKSGSQCAGEVTHAPASQGLLTWKATTNTDTEGRTHLTIDLNAQIVCNNDFPPLVGSMLTLAFADFPQLMMAGGSAAGLPMGATDPIVVVRVDANTVAALDAKCTHRGCTVTYNAPKKELDCPCHGSIFDLMGKVLASPAVTPLKTYAATLMSDRIVVNVV